MKQDDCQLVVQKAKEITGTEDNRVIPDNGPQFKAKQFKNFIRSSGMDKTYTSPYYPQNSGKIGRWHKELKNGSLRSKTAHAASKYSLSQEVSRCEKI